MCAREKGTGQIWCSKHFCGIITKRFAYNLQIRQKCSRMVLL
jgi:hypothetical protein